LKCAPEGEIEGGYNVARSGAAPVEQEEQEEQEEEEEGGRHILLAIVDCDD
jgi:hypothetical protein